MSDTLEFLGNALIDRQPDELIGALAMASVAGLAASGLYRVLRSRVPNPGLLLASLAIVANFACILLACGYVLRVDQARRIERYRSRAVQADLLRRTPPPFEPNMARRLLDLADEDGDGSLTEREVRHAAESFLDKMPIDGRGTVDPNNLGIEVRRVLFPPPHPPDAPPATEHLESRRAPVTLR